MVSFPGPPKPSWLPAFVHTAITEFLRRTGNLKLAQMLAGHADIGTTANIYAHLDTTDLETALKAIDEG
jgi:site-specific recombinase XerD